MPDRITPEEIAHLRSELDPLIGVIIPLLAIPKEALIAFEPSQIGTIVGTLMDACIPYLEQIPQVGISKHVGIIGEREGYPDYLHESGARMELKLLYRDNRDMVMKRPPTVREPSARLTQKVTVKNVIPDKDTILIVAYQLQPQPENPGLISPAIVDLELFSAIELVEARDARMEETGGRWFGNYETPTILSRIGKSKLKRGEDLDVTTYGRKESEGWDFNEDTNFGKLKRIPHPLLQSFLAKNLNS